MPHANTTSNSNNLLISLASTIAVGYLSRRSRLFRRLWRFVPLLVVLSAWFLKRQAQDASTAVDQMEPEAEASAW